MRKILIALMALILCLVLPACSAASTASIATETPVGSGALPLSPPASPTMIFSVSYTPTPASFAPTARPFNPALQPLEDSELPPVELCSPLSEHPLAELPEIVSDPYNPPAMGSDARHQGVDFSYYRRGQRTSIHGVGIQSVFAGRVVAAISDSFPYGNVVIIETPASDLPPWIVEQHGIRENESLYVLYAHLNSVPLVSLGDRVPVCQALGEVGKSGNAGIPHLHLEMRIGPTNQDFASMAFYSTQTTQEERDNYTLWRMSGEFRHLDPMSVLVR
jgi:murein DD-endopeptidase MepM/ murein hydrolase activator NlpD